MAEYHLSKWSVTSDSDPFKAPEVQTKKLAGLRVEDKKEIVTSKIVNVEGKKITTYSGSVYYLEDVDPEFLQWMQDNGFSYDETNPIKMKVVK